MSTISFSEGGNVGGLYEIFLAYWYEFTSLNPIAFKDGRGWSQMDFLPESASCKESSGSGDNGPEHSYSLVLSFNKQDEAKVNAFKRYLGQVGIVRYTDNNFVTRLLGSFENPVTIKTDSDTGNNPADMNHFKITVTWLNNEPARVV
jgi:hypothetical protein